MKKIMTQGNRAVVINSDDEKVWANVYVNACNGLDHADITNIRWNGQSLQKAIKWAEKQLAA